MKDRRCEERSCGAGYNCVTRVRDCTLLSSYEVECQDINECASNPCISGGICHNLHNRYTCSCRPGYHGTRCELDINECASNPCMHRGTCHNLINRYTCSCQPGYHGTRCELDINECASNPCINEGTCHNLINRYTCSCQPGYHGTRCELDINECASNPCMHGGTCHNLINRFTCSCQPGYHGTRCELDINECASNPCINGATCHNLINRYTCSCPPGYYGTRCELDKDECASNPCLHGATCHNLINRFTCSCHDGFQGPRCEHDIDECASNPCNNGGTCHNLENKFTCSCLDGYYGTQCEHDINECASNPCNNGGTCHDLRNNFTCSCLNGYYGTLCELECTRPKYCDEYKCTTETDFICIKCYGQGKTPKDSVYFISSDQKNCTDQSPPQFSNCPSEMVQKYDSGKGSYVNWEPIHVDENIGNFSLSSNIQNGAFFSFGDHSVVYNAIDDSGNANSCNFTIRVIEIQDKACTAPPVPFHGFLGCQNKGALQCSIHSCDKGYLLKNNDSHTCESGVWNPEFPKDFIATSCIKPEPTYLRRNYTFTFNCPHLMINAAELRDCINQSGLCPEGDILLCDRPFQRIEGQQLSSQKLQIWMIMEGKLSFDTNKQLLVQNMDDHGQKIADLFQTGLFLTTCTNLTCDFGEISSGQISEVCAEGSTFYQVNGYLVCAKCGPGWFYAKNTCIQCPEGFYQDIAGQQDCKRCPDERTSMIGAFSISQCYDKLVARELLSPFDTTTVVGGAIGGLFLLWKK
ncbi:neurogenic locus notch homolog protein 1-like [Saccostrea echinata]|uniref:neurogenic locus notch homolog protein 1-like n=1 Tax=Saccostrea echinata TaxID=191078 RepID=UPI002A81885F|nr:neurogenic locus notch homolog protein 1-like [Saccostrea echinata]